MACTSSRRVARALCVTILVAVFGGTTSANRPPVPPDPPHVEPTVDLGAVVGPGSCANALTELGTVVGGRNEFGIFRGFSWSAAGGLVDLGTDTTALDVNDRGQIAGQGAVSGTGLDARLWTRDGTMRIAVGAAYSLNNRTEVVGFHLPPVGDPPIVHGFRWSPARGLEDVESLTGETPPWSYFAPLAITRFIRADGVMAGERGGVAVLWQPDGALTTLGPGVANGLNGLDVAVGATRLSDGNPVAWIGGTPTILTDAAGEATDVNAAGYVVGWMLVGGERHGFVWHADRGLQDLGPGQAQDIDELGAVAGCRGLGDATRATVWQVAMTDAESLVGVEWLARRLLADVGAKRSRAVFREIRLAQDALDRSHDRVAARHLERAVRAFAVVVRSANLPPEWAEAFRRVGRRIAHRF